MGRPTRGGKRQGRQAYLKRKRSFYDPYSPYAIRTRGAKVIDLGSPVPIQTTENSPRREAQAQADIERDPVKKEALVQMRLWQSLRLQKLTEFHRIPVIVHERYSLVVYWHGDEYYIFETNEILGFQRRSRKYKRHECWDAIQGKRVVGIYWEQTVALTDPPPGTVPPAPS